MNQHNTMFRGLQPLPRRSVIALLRQKCFRVRDLQYSCQANQKTREGGNHADRDAQFAHINTTVKAAMRYLEVSRQNRAWSPEDAVVTVLLRRWDQETKNSTGVRVEHLRARLDAKAA